jgi:hypothetical protein
MSYYIKTIGKKADVAAYVLNQQLDEDLKKFLYNRIASIPDPAPTGASWGQYDSVFLEAQGHFPGQDTIKLEGVNSAPPAPAPAAVTAANAQPVTATPQPENPTVTTTA